MECVDARIRQLAQDMAEKPCTKRQASVWRLRRLDVHLQLVVVDVSETRDQLLVLINPELLESDGLQEGEEGCLSVPGVYDKVERAERVLVRYLNLDGQPQQIAADGLLAVCLQHEMDHLQGKVFVEHLSRLKQMRIKSHLAKQAKITA